MCPCVSISLFCICHTHPKSRVHCAEHNLIHLGPNLHPGSKLSATLRCLVSLFLRIHSSKACENWIIYSQCVLSPVECGRAVTRHCVNTLTALTFCLEGLSVTLGALCKHEESIQSSKNNSRQGPGDSAIHLYKGIWLIFFLCGDQT